MSCTSPVLVWDSKVVNESGKRSPVFTATKGIPGSEHYIPCHQCTGCRVDHGSTWKLRLIQESRFHDMKSFLTLTINEAHYPKDGSIRKKDLQLFFRRLRKHYPGLKVSYYAVGEYGTRTGRAHYHVILFGWDFHVDRRPHSKNEFGHQLYKSATLDAIWGKGECLIGAVSSTSCGYVSGYAMKKVNGKRAEEHYRHVDKVTGETWIREREFSLISTRPAIGLRHFQKYANQMYIRGSVIDMGRELPIPKYYDRKLGEVDPGRLERVKDARIAKALDHPEDSTPERLLVKEALLLAKRREYKTDTL